AARERLQVDVGRVHDGVKVAARLLRDVSGGHGHGFHADRATRLRRIDGVLGEDDGIVVRERDAGAARLARRLRYLLRPSRIAEPLHLPSLGDVPILAELAPEIAPCRAEAEHAGPRQEVIERLLLDGIDAEPGGLAVARKDDPVAHSLPRKAEGS